MQQVAVPTPQGFTHTRCDVAPVSPPCPPPTPPPLSRRCERSRRLADSAVDRVSSPLGLPLAPSRPARTPGELPAHPPGVIVVVEILFVGIEYGQIVVREWGDVREGQIPNKVLLVRTAAQRLLGVNPLDLQAWRLPRIPADIPANYELEIHLHVLISAPRSDPRTSQF